MLSRLTLSLALILIASTALASPVYKWQDKQGVIHYSSKADQPEAKPADLPKIMRAEVKLPKAALKSCNDHGGINCQVGADKDGSVVCFDGFREASARFRFSCSSPRLEIADISEADPGGVFTVYVRNSSSVKASTPALILRPGDGKEFQLQGPEEIDPLGMGEFVFRPAGDGGLKEKATLAQLDISCANCP